MVNPNDSRANVARKTFIEGYEKKGGINKTTKIAKRPSDPKPMRPKPTSGSNSRPASGNNN